MKSSEVKNWYLNNFTKFENSLNGENSSRFDDVRKEAIDSFAELNFPNTFDEEWKYTNIQPILQDTFKPADDMRTKALGPDLISKFKIDGIESVLVFINGHYSETLSSISELPKGLIIKNLFDAFNSHADLIKSHFAKHADFKKNIFTALSTAFTKDGAFIYFLDKAILEEPIHLLFLSSGGEEKLLNQPRNLIIAGNSVGATIIEHYAGIDNTNYFTNAVTEIYVGENSNIEHVKFQTESPSAYHIATMEVSQERNSSFRSHAVSFGGEISRNNFNARFLKPGSESTFNGLFMLSNSQLFDTHTFIDHAKPYCASHELYKGILDDRSRGVFNGKIMVRKDAQKTNAFQENNNLILSNEALVNTKPQLEIFADDVKCSHGATIGQLDKNSLFYLKSRGINEKTARSILIHAFASDVIKSVKNGTVRSFLEDALTGRLESLHHYNQK